MTRPVLMLVTGAIIAVAAVLVLFRASSSIEALTPTPPPTFTPTWTMTPTPTITPTPTPKPLTCASTGNASMCLSVKNGEGDDGLIGCDDVVDPSKCSVWVGNQFDVTVEAAGIPAGGYSGFQTEVFLGGLVWKPRPACTDEVVWPDENICLRAPGGAGQAQHFGLTALVPPLPLSSFQGGLVQLDVHCPEAGSYKLALTAYESQGNVYGAAYVDENGDPVLAKVAGQQGIDLDGDTVAETVDVADTLTINCEPVDINLAGDWGVTYVSAESGSAFVCDVTVTQVNKVGKTANLTVSGTCALGGTPTGKLNMTGTLNRTSGEFDLSGAVGSFSNVNASGIVTKGGGESKGTWDSKDPQMPDSGAFAAARVVDSASGTIGPGGGSVTTGAGDPVEAELYLPPGALGVPTEISIDVLSPFAAPDPQAFLPHVPDPGSVPPLVLLFNLGPDGTTLSTPGTLTLTYQEGTISGGFEDSIGVLHFNGFEYEYVPVIARDTDLNTVTVAIEGFSGYGIYDPAVADTDSDGCLDRAETGDVPSDGGQRNPLYYWDVFDTPNDANVRDRTIVISDIVRVLNRYGAAGDPTINPLTAPPPTGYHTSLDRGALAGPNPWDREPADGNSAIGDIVAVLAQFGLDCWT